jgi:hypothetical protein
VRNIASATTTKNATATRVANRRSVARLIAGASRGGWRGGGCPRCVYQKSENSRYANGAASSGLSMSRAPRRSGDRAAAVLYLGVALHQAFQEVAELTDADR